MVLLGGNHGQDGGHLNLSLVRLVGLKASQATEVKSAHSCLLGRPMENIWRYCLVGGSRQQGECPWRSGLVPSLQITAFD